MDRTQPDGCTAENAVPQLDQVLTELLEWGRKLARGKPAPEITTEELTAWCERINDAVRTDLNAAVAQNNAGVQWIASVRTVLAIGQRYPDVAFPKETVHWLFTAGQVLGSTRALGELEQVSVMHG